MIKYPKFLKVLTYGTILYVLLWGISMVFFLCKPFWIDEWRLIYNLKFKSFKEIWGPLSYTQQFPRVYLYLLKRFAHHFNYNYMSLRLPALCIASISILLVSHIKKKLYDAQDFFGYLFVFMFLGFSVFLDYLVQTKHYEMELLLSLIAIWQVLIFNKLYNGVKVIHYKYVLLIVSLFLGPFFSYTYPIVMASVYAVSLLYVIRHFQHKKFDSSFWKLLLPMVVGIGGLLWAYKLDIAQLMADQQMHHYWSYKMISAEHGLIYKICMIWNLFAVMGSGLIFEIIFGILGLISFIYGVILLLKQPLFKAEMSLKYVLNLYSITLICLVFILFFIGKLPIGEAKFNAFILPALAILLIQWLSGPIWPMVKFPYPRIIAVILYLGLIGNIVSTSINTLSGEEYEKRVAIYHTTNNALQRAIQSKLPIYTTPQVAWPDEIMIITPYLTNMPPRAIMATWPNYPAQGGVPIMDIDSVKDGIIYPLNVNLLHTSTLIANGKDIITNMNK